MSARSRVDEARHDIEIAVPGLFDRELRGKLSHSNTRRIEMPRQVHRRAQGLRVPRPGQDTELAVPEQPFHAGATSGRSNRKARCKGFNDNGWDAFIIRRQHEDICVVEQLRDVGHMTWQRNSIS